MVPAMPMPKKYLGLDSKRDFMMPDPLDNVRRTFEREMGRWIHPTEFLVLSCLSPESARRFDLMNNSQERWSARGQRMNYLTFYNIPKALDAITFFL